MGKILRCNQSFGKLFGYSKLELTGKSLESLIPKLYLTYTERVKHKILDAFWSPLEKFTISSFYSMFGMHKNDYIFPLKLGIEKMSSAFKGRDMLITIDIDKKNFSPRVLHIITTRDLFIRNFSSSNYY